VLLVIAALDVEEGTILIICVSEVFIFIRVRAHPANDLIWSWFFV